MKPTGSADLKLMGGQIPPWLFERMVRLSRPMVEAIIMENGQRDFLRRISDPFWFQSFGSVIGMDWNSSGVTTAVLAALKKAINPHARQLGLFVCGGKGKDSLQTPNELLRVGEATGLNGNDLARFSKLTAKVDNTAVQDGFQIYLHGFIVSSDGDWSVIQQGMQPTTSSARRYHWHSASVRSFVEEPHSAICGDHQGEIVNLVDKRAIPAQESILGMTTEDPEKMLQEIRRLEMPMYADVEAKDIDLKRLGGVLLIAREMQTKSFEELLLVKGLGPRTLRSLALVSEVIYGTPARFSDPARFSFAHGGKSGRPFPVTTTVYDETIEALTSAVRRAKIGDTDKQLAIRKLSELAQKVEADVIPDGDFDRFLQSEKAEALRYGGRTIDRPNSG